MERIDLRGIERIENVSNTPIVKWTGVFGKIIKEANSLANAIKKENIDISEGSETVTYIKIEDNTYGYGFLLTEGKIKIFSLFFLIFHCILG